MNDEIIPMTQTEFERLMQTIADVWNEGDAHEAERIGFGEYSFEMHGRYHGIVEVK